MSTLPKWRKCKWGEIIREQMQNANSNLQDNTEWRTANEVRTDR